MNESSVVGRGKKIESRSLFFVRSTRFPLQELEHDVKLSFFLCLSESIGRLYVPTTKLWISLLALALTTLMTKPFPLEFFLSPFSLSFICVHVTFSLSFTLSIHLSCRPFLFDSCHMLTTTDCVHKHMRHILTHANNLTSHEINTCTQLERTRFLCASLLMRKSGTHLQP